MSENEVKNELKYFEKAFAESGDKKDVTTNPVDTEISYNGGYSQNYNIDKKKDPTGRSIELDKMNQLFHDSSSNIKHYQENLYPTWVANKGDGAPFSYGYGFIVSYKNSKYQSLKPDNTTNVETGDWIKWNTYTVKNKFRDNQNFNVKGADGEIKATAQTFDTGKEFSKGRFAVKKLVDIKKVDGIISALSGSYYVEYVGDFTKCDYGVKLENGTQSKTGCTLELKDGNTRLTIDFELTSSHKFPFLSDQVGSCEEVNDEESKGASSANSESILITSSRYVTVGDEPATVVIDASLPYAVSRDGRYVLKNPFKNTHVIVEAEVFYNGMWGYAGYRGPVGGVKGSVASKAGSHDIVVQVARDGTIDGRCDHSGSTFGTTAAVTSPVPCRVWVYKLNEGK